jgi:uncharacterized membrane protein
MNVSLKSNLSRWSIALLILAIALGICFRFTNLENKIYWHDEAYTTIRTTGYRADFVFGEIFSNHFISPEELGKFQQLKPNSTAFNTLESLAIEDPQHPPLYFLLSRYWEKLFGFNIVSSRIPPILLSLLGLPIIYLLSLELFPSRFTALLATTFLALSPVDILLAQIARQYSLLTLLTLLGQLFLLKAIRSPSLKNWLLYSLITALGLYTHLFFILNIVSQGIFILVYSWFYQKRIKELVLFTLSSVVSIILYLPWLLVFFRNSERAFTSTSWSKVTFIDWGFFTKVWMLTFTCPFTDSDFGFDNLATYSFRSLFFLITLIAFFTLYRKADRITFWFLLISSVGPFLLLAIPDIILQTSRSTVTRYLIAGFPTLYLAVAFLFSEKLFRGRNLWKVILALWMTANLISNYYNARSDTTWAKPPSFWNGSIARNINTDAPALVISDRGDSWTNLGDLLAINYHLRRDVRYFLTANPPDVEKLRKVVNESEKTIFLFRPSSELLSAFLELDIALDRFPPDYQLWKVVRSPTISVKR